MVNGSCRVVSSTLWVAILLGYNMVNAFKDFHIKIKIINFLVFVNIIVRSLDFVCEDVSYIHELVNIERRISFAMFT